MNMQCCIRTERKLGKRDPMLYGHFIEHFHRQIYGGVFDPESPFSDKDGLRTDVLEAMRKIRVPVLRWPGGCFVSSREAASPPAFPYPVFSRGSAREGAFLKKRPLPRKSRFRFFLCEINQHLALSGVEEGTVIVLDGMGEGCAEKSRVCSGGRSCQTGRLRTMP